MLTSAWILRDFGNRFDDGDDRIPGDTTDGQTVGIRMMKKMSVSVLYSSELKVYWQRMQCLNNCVCNYPRIVNTVCTDVLGNCEESYAKKRLKLGLIESYNLF